MRILTLIAFMFAATVASAQEAAQPPSCDEKPTQSCVLDMAVEASLSSGLPDGSLPYGSIVAMAARAGRLDFALGLAHRIDSLDTLAAAAFVEAARGLTGSTNSARSSKAAARPRIPITSGSFRR